jgi:hypothetical protein
VREQKPSGDYASTIVREAGRPEVHLGFKDERDARKLAEAVGTQTTNNYPAWTTQQAFEFDVARIAELAASLPYREGRLCRDAPSRSHKALMPPQQIDCPPLSCRARSSNSKDYGGKFQRTSIVRRAVR